MKARLLKRARRRIRIIRDRRGYLVYIKAGWWILEGSSLSKKKAEKLAREWTIHLARVMFYDKKHRHGSPRF